MLTHLLTTRRVCTFQIKAISKVSNTFQCHQSVSYQKAEQSSGSGCALTQLPFSSLSPLPCRLSQPQTFVPWVQADHPGLSSCCCSMLSCHPGQPAPLWFWGAWSAYECGCWCKKGEGSKKIETQTPRLTLKSNKSKSGILWLRRQGHLTFAAAKYFWPHTLAHLPMHQGHHHRQHV